MSTTYKGTHLDKESLYLKEFSTFGKLENSKFIALCDWNTKQASSYECPLTEYVPAVSGNFSVFSAQSKSNPGIVNAELIG